MQAAIEQTKERRLAHAVATHQPDLFAGGNGDRDFVEQDLRAAAQDEILESDQNSCAPGPENA